MLTGTDPDADVLSFTVVSAPTHGTLAGTAPNLIYSPDANFNGSDSFTFTVNDGTADSTIATVGITVTPVNDAPIAAALSFSTPRDTAAAATLSATDVDNDTLSFGVVSQPAHGVLSGSGSSLTYTPNTGFAGADSFTYTANDGTVDSNIATVSITVVATNRPPSATAASATTAEDVAVGITLSGTDPDGNTLTFAVVGLPAHGTLSGSGATRTYTPAANYNGPDSFTFTVNDGLVTSSAGDGVHHVSPLSTTSQWPTPLTVSAIYRPSRRLSPCREAMSTPIH